MKKIILPLTFLLLAVSCNPAQQKSSFQKKIDDLAAKTGFHIYVPSYLPQGFDLRVEDDALLGGGVVGYRLQSDSQNQRVVILQSKGDVSGIITNRQMTERKWWSVKEVQINNQTGYLGKPRENKPSQRFLYFSVNGVSVNVHTLDSVADDELVKIAASMK